MNRKLLLTTLSLTLIYMPAPLQAGGIRLGDIFSLVGNDKGAIVSTTDTKTGTSATIRQDANNPNRIRVDFSDNPDGYSEVDLSTGSWINKTNDGAIVSTMDENFISTIYNPQTGEVDFYIAPDDAGIAFLDKNKKVFMFVPAEGDDSICYDEELCKKVTSFEDSLTDDDEDDEAWF